MVEVDLLKSLGDASSGEFAVLQYEFKDGVNKYLENGQCPSKVADRRNCL